MYCGTHVVPSDFGVGLKIVGGVNCERCRNMHAMVTSVLPGTECAHTVREGKSWEREGGGSWVFLVQQLISRCMPDVIGYTTCAQYEDSKSFDFTWHETLVPIDMHVGRCHAVWGVGDIHRFCRKIREAVTSN